MDEQIKIRKNMIGKRFGKLVVLERAPDIINSSNRHRAAWLCKCDCGNTTVVSGELLRAGTTRSCGCLFLEWARNKRKDNVYDLSGEFGKGYTEKGTEFWFDLEDYEKIKDYYWYEAQDHHYICSRRKNKMILLHRLIMGEPEGLVIDHIGGNNTVHDNRKSNLRIATQSQNVFNTKLYPQNTSGTSGVWWDNKCKKWRSVIIFNNQRIYLGSYINKEDAVNARKEAENKYFGDFTFNNSQDIYKNLTIRG